LTSAALLFALAARADVVYLKNGKSIEGKVTVKGDKVVVEIPHGSVSFPKSKVLRIERKVSAVETYDQKYAALPAKDAPARVKLATWCKRQGMGNRAEALLRDALEIDSDHPEARKLLGYVKHEGRWVTRPEKFRAMGLVEFEGQWHKPESVVSIKKARAESKRAEELRRKAEVELEIRLAELAKVRAERAKLEAERAKLEAERARLEAERRRLIGIFGRYPHFKMIGGSYYYYPDYPACRKGVIIIRARAKKKTSADDDDVKDDADKEEGDDDKKSKKSSTKTVPPAAVPGVPAPAP
jgi:hypothetical protein